MSRIRVSPHSSLDDPSNPDERIITAEIVLSESVSPPDHENVVLRFRQTHDNHLVIDTLACSDGVSFDIPQKHRVPEPVLRAHWVRAPEGVWYVIGGCDVSPIMSESLQSFVTDVVTDTCRCLGQTLLWEDDVDDESGDLE